MFRVAWPTVGRIVERVVARVLPRDRLDDLECIAVDETSYKRGHRYLTVVVNLFTNRVVWLGEGKSQKTLAAFFEELGPERCERIRVVAMDMSEAYKSAVAAHAKNAEIVYDRYHVVKLLLDAIDEIRREEVRKLSGSERSELKNTRYALLRNPKRHLSDKDRDAVTRIRRTNQKLARAYELRCDFEDLWELDHPDDARDFLMNWTRAALQSRREALRRFAKTLRNHIDGILGYFKFWRMSSGPIEGTNNKIKLAIHRAFGFHSVHALMSMVYLCCSGVTLSW
jgi:transposase